MQIKNNMSREGKKSVNETFATIQDIVQASTFITDTKNQQQSPRHVRHNRLEQAQTEFSKMIEGLDHKISKMLSKQEQEYISSFKYYVTQKEEEIQKLQEKLRKGEELAKQKESTKLKKLEAYSEVKQKEAAFLAELCKDSNKEVLKWKSKVLNLTSDCSFLEKKIKTVMKEVKMLRYFLLQAEGFAENLLNSENDQEKDMKKLLLAEIRKINRISDVEEIDDSTMQFFDSNKFTETRKTQEQRRHSIPVPEQSTVPSHRSPRGDNVEAIYEMKKFVRSYEMKTSQTIGQLKRALERQQKENAELKKKLVAEQLRENDMESIFMDCVQQTRKDIYKRRLKSLVNKKTGSESEQDINQIEFLYKLSLLKDRENFTATDKANILKLFVENEYVVQKIYEFMFPTKISEYSKLKEPSFAEECTLEFTNERGFKTKKSEKTSPENLKLPRLRQLVTPAKSGKIVTDFKTYLNASLTINPKKLITEKPHK